MNNEITRKPFVQPKIFIIGGKPVVVDRGYLPEIGEYVEFTVEFKDEEGNEDFAVSPKIGFKTAESADSYFDSVNEEIVREIFIQLVKPAIEQLLGFTETD